MKEKDAVKLNRLIQEWINQNDNMVGKDSVRFLRKHAIDKAEDLEHSLKALTEDNRLLQIGVVGRVKAGKSSLLNALVFDGHNILPKAATPMTAALTTITYAKTFSASAQFYTKEDIASIKANSERYNERLKKEREKAAEELRRRSKSRHGDIGTIDGSHKKTVEDEKFNKNIENMAIRAVEKDQSLAAAHDQYQRIIRSGLDVSELETQSRIEAPDAQSLAKKLLDYVGADGRYMPVTKSVDVFLPFEALQDMRIIDTPGLNDPVQSREERTCELLKDCDVVFIVSPAGQFLSEQDLDVMGRITQKEGIQELVLIASQVDNQLYGSDTHQPTLYGALEKITQALSLHMIDTLKRLKVSNPEVGSTFDGLIQQGAGKVLYTSGMCHNLSVRFDQQDGWDSGERHVWQNLQRHYPDFFDVENADLCHANLDLLANTTALKSVLEQVRTEKDRIIEQRKTELLRAKYSALEALCTDLMEFTKQKQHQIKSANIDDLNEQKKQLHRQMTVTKYDLNNMLDKCKMEYRDTLDKKLRAILGKTYAEVEAGFKNAIFEERKTETRERSGVFSLVARKLWGGGTYEHTYTEQKVYPQQIRNGIQAFVGELASQLEIVSDRCAVEFKGQLYGHIVAILRKHLGDGVDGLLIIDSVQGVILKLSVPRFVLEYDALKSLSTATVLRDNEAVRFMEDANHRLYELKGYASGYIHTFINELYERLPHSIADSVFKDMQERIQELEGQVNNVLMTIDRLQRMQNDLENM